MGQLCAFEASARLGSFTLAATELSLTQSAVSRQIRALEEMLGAELFVRDRQTVRLTERGEAYAHEVRGSLQRLAAATLGCRANPQGGELNVAILPTFGTRWLAPRLPRFLAQNPGVTINLMTRLEPFDFKLDAVDAAIHYGTTDWPGAELDYLMPETVVPACSRKLREQYGLAEPEDLLRAPLLHLASRPQGWRRWFESFGIRTAPEPGMYVDQFAVAVQAAIADIGVVLLPRFLFEAEFQRGDLVEAVNGGQRSAEAYFLAYAPDRATYPPLEAFRKWLREEAATAKP